MKTTVKGRQLLSEDNCQVNTTTQYSLTLVGTTDAFLHFLDDNLSQLDKPSVKFVQSACHDFSNAFDRLFPSIILKRMYAYGFNSNIVRLVGNFLYNRQQYVRYGGNISEFLDIKIGAPQGTKMGPCLWLNYVNDLIVEGFSCVKYADDTTCTQMF